MKLSGQILLLTLCVLPAVSAYADRRHLDGKEQKRHFVLLVGCSEGATRNLIAKSAACPGISPYSSMTIQSQTCQFGYLYNSWENDENGAHAFGCDRRCVVFPTGLTVFTPQAPGDPLLGIINKNTGHAPAWLEVFLGNGQSPQPPRIPATQVTPQGICLVDGNGRQALSFTQLRDKINEACVFAIRMNLRGTADIACNYCVRLMAMPPHAGGSTNETRTQRCQQHLPAIGEN